MIRKVCATPEYVIFGMGIVVVWADSSVGVSECVSERERANGVLGDSVFLRHLRPTALF